MSIVLLPDINDLPEATNQKALGEVFKSEFEPDLSVSTEKMHPYWDAISPDLYPPLNSHALTNSIEAQRLLSSVFPDASPIDLWHIGCALLGHPDKVGLDVFRDAVSRAKASVIQQAVQIDESLEPETEESNELEDDGIHRISSALPPIEEVRLDEDEPAQAYESAPTAGSQSDENTDAQLVVLSASVEEANQADVCPQEAPTILSLEEKDRLREQAAKLLAARGDQEEIEDFPSQDLPLMPGRAALAVRLARWFNRNSKTDESRAIPQWLILGIAVLILLIVGLSLAYLFNSNTELSVKVNADSERLNQTIELVNKIDKWRTNTFLAQEKEKRELTLERDEYQELAADFDSAMRDYERANLNEQNRLEKKIAALNRQIKQAQQRIKTLEATNASQANLAPRE